ncbi:hypothetical protein D9619_007278 [Psilocybe cf. subviscida]|uniref:Potassium transporter n=1 Tax=Psilocybe cf. subviscida TaxID=2480587 RepID=A0A8H5EWS2_9AGAR|nr:hypothetical protein D9619_007278 [Psilocybe cf. subviscida]
MSAPASGGQNLNLKRTAVHLSGLSLIGLSFQTLGIVYSDIGTSPLYVLNGIWPTSGPVPPSEDIIGGISAIIWSLTIVPLLKYASPYPVGVSLYFGTKEGEGGSFALYQGLFPRREVDHDADRTLTGDFDFSKKEPRPTSFKEKVRWPLLLWCLFGTALTMADGIFTPAVSVTSAVSGIAVAKPSVGSDITPVSIAFLIAFFFAQQVGTARLAFTFAPIAFIWFLLLMGTGIYNCTFYPGIFRAFDPSRAILLFVRTKNYDLLSGIFLAVTGSEAMFANLGQFNSASIRIGFCTFVYPALVLAYLGQGARLIHDGSTLNGVFYQTIPGPIGGPLYWIVFVFAVLATLIASQAMITATFSLTQQLINSKAFPPLRMVYTSETIQGQVYIPAANWILLIVTIILVGVFKNLTNLTNAYGFAVATVMITTSVMLSFQMRYIKKWPIIVPIAYFVLFGFVDALFWGASFRKVPLGAWVPLMIGVILTSIMFFWVWAKGLEDAFDGANRMNLRHFIHQRKVVHTTTVADDNSSTEHQELSYHITKNPIDHHSSEKFEDDTPFMDSTELQRVPTCSIFHKVASAPGVPHTFTGFIRQWPCLPRVVVFLSVCVVPIARVPVDERYAVTKVRSVEGVYGVTYYVGFRDAFDVQARDLIDKICLLEEQYNPAGAASIIREIRAVAMTATHIALKFACDSAPHYHVVSKRLNVPGTVPSFIVNFVRRFFIESLYRRAATMFPETANWLTSADEIIHVGINAEI